MADTIYLLEGLDCTNCAREVEQGVASLVGVREARVDFFSAKLHVDGSVSAADVQARVAALGFKAVLPQHALEPRSGAGSSGGIIGFLHYLLKQTETRLALAGGALMLVTLIASLLGLPQTFADGLFTVALAVALYPITRSGLRNLLINHDFNINLLMTIAAIGALLIGETLEAATVIFLFAVGEALEGYTADRARSSLQGLMELAPAQAFRKTADGTTLVPVEELRVDDIISVMPGERIPMDGAVLAGESSINQAPITGESTPVYKAPGAEVYAGSVNGEGLLEVRVTRLAQDNTLSRIIQLVEASQNMRARSQRLIDRFAHYYTPAMVLIAAAVALLPPLLVAAPFYDTPDQHGWLYRALTILVIACPCALVISTPVTVISAITAAARRGVLIKGGAHLEALAGTRVFAFDKTGTLTYGRPTVQEYHAADCAHQPDCPQCADVLALAAAVESQSTHPLAKAVQHAAVEQHLGSRYPAAANVRTLSGRGIQGYVDNALVTIGSHSYFHEQYPHTAALCQQIACAEAKGHTAMLVAAGETIRGYITVADRVRPETREVITALRTMGITTVMLTGDNPAAAAAIAAQTNIDAVRAGLLPEDKVTVVQQLHQQHGRVAMIGDGINDTPALAAAAVGIAMGAAGSAQAIETADIALMADDLRQLPYAWRLAHFARRLIRANIALSLGMKGLFLLLALLGSATLWMAIFADVGMALLVTLNGMRPLRFEVTPQRHSSR